MMSFSQFQFDHKLLNLIEKEGLSVPTPIQNEAIPKILDGADLRATAQTGTGKTAAFLLPAIQRVLAGSLAAGTKKRGPKILILTPTRELAMQVASEAVRFGGGICQTVSVVGGTAYVIQNKRLSKPFDLLVATPGRLLDQIERNRIDLSKVEMLILDEADRMLDMGFFEPVQKIANCCPKKRQTLLFSATFNPQVSKLSDQILNQPVEIEVTPQKERHESIEQRFKETKSFEEKQEALLSLLQEEPVDQMIIFTATKRSTTEISDWLSSNGFDSLALHGDMDQRQRTRTMKNFQKKIAQLLVATDVAARGIDIATISHVVNFDLPRAAEDYIHRIGRTGRAGAKGVAFSFVGRKDLGALRAIETYTGVKTGLFQEKKKHAGPKKNMGSKRKVFFKKRRGAR